MNLNVFGCIVKMRIVIFGGIGVSLQCCILSHIISACFYSPSFFQTLLPMTFDLSDVTFSTIYVSNSWLNFLILAVYMSTYRLHVCLRFVSLETRIIIEMKKWVPENDWGVSDELFSFCRRWISPRKQNMKIPARSNSMTISSKSCLRSFAQTQQHSHTTVRPGLS